MEDHRRQQRRVFQVTLEVREIDVAHQQALGTAGCGRPDQINHRVAGVDPADNPPEVLISLWTIRVPERQIAHRRAEHRNRHSLDRDKGEGRKPIGEGFVARGTILPGGRRRTWRRPPLDSPQVIIEHPESFHDAPTDLVSSMADADDGGFPQLTGDGTEGDQGENGGGKQGADDEQPEQPSTKPALQQRGSQRSLRHSSLGSDGDTRRSAIAQKEYAIPLPDMKLRAGHRLG